MNRLQTPRLMREALRQMHAGRAQPCGERGIGADQQSQPPLAGDRQQAGAARLGVRRSEGPEHDAGPTRQAAGDRLGIRVFAPDP